MAKRTQRGPHPGQAAEMQRQVREFRRSVCQWAAQVPIGTTAYLGCDVLNHALLLMDMQLTAAIDAVPYECQTALNIGSDSLLMELSVWLALVHVENNAMGQHLRVSELVPGGFIVDEVADAESGIRICLRASSARSCCPGCGTISTRVHSRYTRQLADLSLSGRPVHLLIRARRFHCDGVLCPRRIFAEHFDTEVLAPWSRRMARLDYIIHHLGLALGGRPAARFARRLMLPASNDTLLRVIRRRGRPTFIPPTVIGIDDWAWRRDQRYGTLICDLERRQTIVLLPDREPATAQTWLTAQPQIAIVARDRGGG
ncbi:hypothetical protein GCM10017653_08490 [Ancylobacter defluvii]|uniref:Transposase IS204/IS1001/IS1096/IS1165 zinc-finger domain-containing protein n=1 Tax=Ancylobacter defluvii TaxID=1282440 RepID=A0A9W6N9P8_9HYPH|nr:hypothetical protein GCM10017653_08490 [Ancylobacter defluvii]